MRRTETRRSRADPSSVAPSARHLLPQGEKGSGGAHDPPCSVLRRTRNDDEFFVFARRFASRRARGARRRAWACGNRDRRPQHARRNRARTHIRARKRPGDGGHAGRSRRAACLRRRRAGRARLPEGPRGLRPALPDSDRGKPARAKGRMLAQARRPSGAERRVAGRRDAFPLPFAPSPHRVFGRTPV